MGYLWINLQMRKYGFTMSNFLQKENLEAWDDVVLERQVSFIYGGIFLIILSDSLGSYFPNQFIFIGPV